jgi:hypothetical protein
MRVGNIAQIQPDDLANDPDDFRYDGRLRAAFRRHRVNVRCCERDKNCSDSYGFGDTTHEALRRVTRLRAGRLFGRAPSLLA